MILERQLFRFFKDEVRKPTETTWKIWSLIMVTGNVLAHIKMLGTTRRAAHVAHEA